MRALRKLIVVLACVCSATAFAQTSSFNATATGRAEPVPALIAQDVQQPDGRIVVTIIPDALTDGSQRFLSGTDWGLWLWASRVHGHFYTTDGERKLIRVEKDGVPLPGTAAVAGQPTIVEVSWSPAGIGLFVNGQLRLYLEGSYRTPPSDMTYGAEPGGSGGYNGEISVEVFDEPASYDPCANYPNWGKVQVFGTGGSNEVPPQPTCQTPPDDGEPAIGVDGTAVATFSWNVPTEYADGSVLLGAEIDSYLMFWGDASRIGRCADRPTARDDDSCYPNSMSIPNGGTVSAPITINLTEDTSLYFSMATVVVSEGDENDFVGDLISSFSNEVARRFTVTVSEEPVVAPGPPTSVDVTFQLTCTTDRPRVNCTITVN